MSVMFLPLSANSSVLLQLAAPRSTAQRGVGPIVALRTEAMALGASQIGVVVPLITENTFLPVEEGHEMVRGAHSACICCNKEKGLNASKHPILSIFQYRSQLSHAFDAFFSKCPSPFPRPFKPHSKSQTQTPKAELWQCTHTTFELQLLTPQCQEIRKDFDKLRHSFPFFEQRL